ncbi:enoyl-CoA hydratase-related protein [Streptomyces sp. NPDC058424]
MGLVNEVVPAQQLDEAVDRWVADILACAPTSLRAIKQMVQRGGGLSPQDAHQLSTPALMAALDSEDAKEGVLAFQQKRPPLWPGQ